MSNRPQLPHDTQRSSSSQSANQSSTKKPLRTTTRRTSLEDEQRQDGEVLKNTTIAVIRVAVQSSLQEFDVELAVALLSQIAETANPPLLPALNNRRYVRKCIEENDELFNLLGECLQKESFSEIRSLEMLQSDHSQPPHTPPAGTRIRNAADELSPRLTLERKTAAAFKDFENYIKYLAIGKLDGYLDSIQRHDKVTDLGVYLPLDPILLLHDLGRHVDNKRIEKLFIDDTVHLFGVSGSGKTRLSLDGLCWNWGLYISCKNTGGPASGSNDFNVATKMLQTMSTWNTGDSDGHSKNAESADRVFAMLLFARVFVLKQLVKYLPLNTDATVARRRWVLAQALPPRSSQKGDDLFVTILQTIRHADTDIMITSINSMLNQFMNKRKDLFPVGFTPLFAVIDEAQVAADHLKEYFRSDTGSDLRPILHEMYSFFLDSEIISGIIISGTGLSMEMVQNTAGSLSAKRTDRFARPLVFTDIGRFTRGDSAQEDYIRRYLTLSENDSDRLLLKRIMYWFSGRHRLTASLIELFLCFENVPRHRVFTSFVEQLTGFKLTDTIELEAGEPPISLEMSSMIGHYSPICDLNHICKEQNREKLLGNLVDVLMRWTLGSELTYIPIEGHMHDIIGYGIGFLDTMTNPWQFKRNMNYPVYISEPLVVLSLSSVFQKHNHAIRETWMTNAFRSARSASLRGYMFAQAILLVLMETFGGKFKPLSHAFHCSESLGSRKVTLVALKRGADDIMQCSPVSWKTGTSDRLGLKANSPEDVLAFLHDPDGKPFLFPDNHMAPDVLCTLQDKETKELIILAVQGKVSPTLNAQKWRDAITSVTPEFFYMVQNGGTRDRYTRVSYPNLVDDLTGSLEMLLRPAVYAPIANSYHRNLCSSIQAQQQSASHSTRQTPRFLRIIAIPDDEEQKCLKGEWKGDVAVLRWDVVERYIGSMADSLEV
ncbi:hypothetical protein BU17DRAFT_92559 [Hysterangium stoloniferum]|nr:hypothetical protein BU17DRAFT_92559 [Hysterangium stoloniferum]